MSKRWSPWDKWESRAFNLYLSGAIESRAMLAERIGRSIGAVRSRVTRHKKCRRPIPPLWTPEDDALLLEMSRIRWRVRGEYLDAFPGRTYRAIKRRLHRLRYGKTGRQQSPPTPPGLSDTRTMATRD